MNTSYVQGQSVEYGEFKPALLTATGPSSYSVTGDVVYNPASGDYINFPMDCTTQSGNYTAKFVPTTAGVIRAGAPAPSQSGWTAFWEYRGSQNQPIPGVPLTLGTASAAATNSVYTVADGLCVVSTTTPPPVGSFVLLSNGTTLKGIIFNGVIVYVSSVVAGTSFSFYFGAAKALHYVSGTDTLKWQRLYGGYTGNPVAAGPSVAVTSVAVATHALTVLCANSAAVIKPGMFVMLQGLAAAEVPQGAIVQVLTTSATQFTANIIAPDLSATTGETATASVLVTNGSAPIQATQTIYPISGSTLAAAATVAATAGIISVMPVVQNLSAGNLVCIQGLSHGSTLNGLVTGVIATGLTNSNVETNGYIDAAVATGTDDAGTLGLLVTGVPPYGNQVTAGTNLSAEVLQFGAIISQL